MEGCQVVIVTDHESLKYIKTQAHLSARQARWLDTLLSYEFNIVYEPGEKNVVVDMLSRQAGPVELAPISIIQGDKTIQDQIKESYGLDPFFSIVVDYLKNPTHGSAKDKAKARDSI